jgi:hypothetical protein
MIQDTTLTVAYLGLHALPGNGWMGGLMLTNGYGYPLDFHYSDPVFPTRLQQILYGPALSTYLKTDVIVPGLLHGCTTPVAAMFVEDATLMGGPARTSINLIRLQSVGLATPTPEADCEGLYQPAAPEATPVRVSWRPEQADTATPVMETLKRLGQHMVVTEPFARLEQALALLAEDLKLAS